MASLHGQLRAAILDGRLRPGVRLPSTRALASAYGVSRNTAVAAYDRLLSEGYVAARRGSGTVVNASLPPVPKGPRIADRGQSERQLNRYWQGRRLADPEAPARHVFQVGIPDVSGFPYAIWRRLLRRVERRYRENFAGSANPQGLAALREAIVQHVSFARAVACRPEDIVVTSGAQQAFDLLARVLVTPGRTTVALEDPGYPPLRAAFEAQRARIALVPVDAEGAVVERVPARARVVCVTPSHQFPLGAVMSSRRRAALLEHCARSGAVVIEDDYDGEFRFAERPLDALQTLDRAQSVFYVGTFSKSLLPDFRLGYLVAPPWAVAALTAAKQVSAGQGHAMEQAAVALLIREGHLARHVRRMQRVYGARRDLILGALRAEFAGRLEALPSVAGLHLATRLEASANEGEVIARARHEGVQLAALSRYYAGRPSLHGLLFGYGNIDEKSAHEGMIRLRRAMGAQKIHGHRNWIR